MHVRLFDIEKGLISIQAEVEISRDYLQHLFSQRTAVIYEIEDILKKHKIEYLKDQAYLNPHPKELMLRNHV